VETSTNKVLLSGTSVLGAQRRIKECLITSDGNVPEHEDMNQNEHYPMQVELALLLLSDFGLRKQTSPSLHIVHQVLEEIFDRLIL
jgi:hypothetical protein